MIRCAFAEPSPVRTSTRALGPRSFHCALEQVGCVRSNTETFADVLLAIRFETLVDGNLDDDRIEREFTHCGVEHVGLLVHESLENVLNSDVILVPLARLAQRMLKDALATLSKLVFVCPKINHLFT